MTNRRYERGDVVWWWSDYSSKKDKAIFVRYDRDFPDEDGIFLIKIHNFKQVFRWPLRLTELAKVH